MTKLDEIRNRRLAPTDIAKINAMAEISEPGPEMEDLEDKQPVLNESGASTTLIGLKPGGNTATEEAMPVNDVAFYGPRVMEFYDYFSKKDTLWPPHVAATLALAACTLKASVVIGQAITDTFGTVLPRIAETPAIPVKTTAPAIPGKKRGRPVGSKNKK